MSRVEVLSPRDVPLGGIRAMTVRRTLPHRDRPFIGAWCFLDHYGPHVVGDGNSGDGTTGGMDVPPHPHTGLQTVSWLFDGEIEHRDSGGVVGLVRPGEVNLMTAGHGVAHSEVSTPTTRVLHGVQLWVALPDAARHTQRAFEHFVPRPFELPDAAGTALVFLGHLRGVGQSPVRAFTPLLGAQLDLAPGARLELDLDPDHEHGILADRGAITLDGQALQSGELGCVDPGPASMVMSAGDDGARVILLGGEPFPEEIVMWWNFIGRSHEEIVEQRVGWQDGSARFGAVPGYRGSVERLPAPPMPAVRLRPRGRTRR